MILHCCRRAKKRQSDIHIHVDTCIEENLEGGEREREKEIDRQTDRKIERDRQTDRDTERERERERGRDKQKDKFVKKKRNGVRHEG